MAETNDLAAEVARLREENGRLRKLLTKINGDYCRNGDISVDALEELEGVMVPLSPSPSAPAAMVREVEAKPYEMEVGPENHGSRMFHTNCPDWMPEYCKGRNTSGVMRRIRGSERDSPDGTQWLLWECLSCHGEVYVGLTKDRQWVTKPHITPQTIAENGGPLPLAPSAPAATAREGWVSVAERLPEAVARVLLWNGKVFETGFWFHDDGGQRWHFGDGLPWFGGRGAPTHWRPLTPPPSDAAATGEKGGE